jgi:hypothetical protein
MDQNPVRQLLAIVFAVAAFAFMYLWLGAPGLAGAFFGVTITICTLGIASGYWVGFDSEADRMVTDLMKWLRQKRSS